jgi:N-acetylneuraminate lyase
MSLELSGIMPAIPTPCDSEDRFEETAFARLAAALYRGGVHGLYVCGATGDAYSLRLEDRKRATEVAVQSSRATKGTVIVHAGTTNSRDSMELASHAAHAGAQAVACMPPANRSFAEVLAFYRDVAGAAQIPLLVYHIPHLTGHAFSRDELCRLLDLPGVAGIKFSASNLFLLRRLLLARPGIALFNGDDELLAAALAYGATGGIGLTYNIFPGFFVALYAAVRAGELARAFAMQAAFTEFLDRVIDFGVFPVLDLLMRERGFGPFIRRRPRTVLDQEAGARFHREVDPLMAAVEASALGKGGGSP